MQETSEKGNRKCKIVCLLTVTDKIRNINNLLPKPSVNEDHSVGKITHCSLILRYFLEFLEKLSSADSVFCSHMT